MRKAAAIIWIGLGVGACGGGGGPQAPVEPQPALATAFPLDGVISWAALPPAQQVMLEFVDGLGSGIPTGKLTTLRWTTTNDDLDVYFALEWSDETWNSAHDIVAGPTDFDGVKILIDTNGDGAGKLVFDASLPGYRAEFLFPMQPDSLGEDGLLTSASRFDLILFDHVELGPETGSIAGLHGLGGLGVITAGWEGLAIQPAGIHIRAQLPEALSGRIVFKTGRWSEFPQVRIGVMAEDGTGAMQLDGLDGTSDHDPVSGLLTAIFERFPKDTLFATDPEAGFVPWDIIETPLDGGAERTLIADGWLNWLPVYGPNEQFFVYLTNRGYTAAHLANRLGQDLGRLIPDQTRITYLDWK